MSSGKTQKGEYKCAFKYVKSRLHRNGLGVAKDEKKELHHFERAAILCGNPDARHNLGYIQVRNGRMDRVVKHFIIALPTWDIISQCIR